MKILRVSARCGSPCGTVNLSQLVDGVDLENGKYVLSLRENIGLADADTARAKLKRFTLGKAKARVHEIAASTVVGVEVESTDVQDFIDLYNAVCNHLGIEHEHLPRPKHHFDDLSFVRGLRNDLRTLRGMIVNFWRPNTADIRETLADKARMDYIDGKITEEERDDIVSGAASR